MEINIEYIGFIKRIYKHGKFFFLIGLFAILVSFSLTSQFNLSFLIGLLFLAVIFFSVAKWNIYFIQYLKIDHSRIILKVYKYNSILVEGEYDIRDFDIEINKATASKRGVSYKMQCKLNNIKFIQYEIHGWSKEAFDKVIKLIKN